MPRTSGILLHPTSLPGDGIGTIGPHAHRFARWLAESGQSWWQMLPVGPTGYGDSPYQSPSTFAGNPLLLDIDQLAEDGWVPDPGFAPKSEVPPYEVDFGSVIPWKTERLAEAAHRFLENRTGLPDGFERFVEAHGGVWLDEFALFTALKRHHGLRPWWEWPSDLVHREHEALADARSALADAIERVRVEQYFFDQQFSALRGLCRRLGIGLIGDVPIFVAHDSADVWANPDLFHLDQQGRPTVVAGVPPDYFSPTGQRWGNPLYDWQRHIDTRFVWWTARMRRALELFDLVRVDHFRGFAASYHIPASEDTAIAGEWVPAPGAMLFDHLKNEFAELPVIAEDLGVITDDVVELRDRYGFPGMKILQFGFGTESHHALDQFRTNVVAYTGTHDNDTAVGWFEDRSAARAPERMAAMRVLDTDGQEFHWALLEGVFASIADTVIAPLQDVLGLDRSARMNLPGTTAGNWRWRFEWSQLTDEHSKRLLHLTRRTGRLAD